MQLIVVGTIIMGTVAYLGELPQVLQFPLPLVGGLFFTIAMVYALIKA